MANFKNISILACALVSVLISNMVSAMEPLHYIHIMEDVPTLPSIKMDRIDRDDDKEVEPKCICNFKMCGLVEGKKNDDSHQKEVCVIDTMPAVAACALISMSIFCCGCPK